VAEAPELLLLLQEPGWRLGEVTGGATDALTGLPAQGEIQACHG